MNSNIYKFKIVSNMPNFKPMYYKTKEEAEKKQVELLRLWKKINVFVRVIDLEDTQYEEYDNYYEAYLHDEQSSEYLAKVSAEVDAVFEKWDSDEE